MTSEQPYTTQADYNQGAHNAGMLGERSQRDDIIARLRDTHAAFPELATQAGRDAVAVADALALADTLRAAAKAYYDTDDDSPMSDSEYDDGIERLRAASAEHPTLAGRFDDLLDKVAAGQSIGGDVKHTTPMLSLDKVVGLDAVRDFVQKVATPVVVEPKLDGLPIRVEYTNGVLTRAVTRGDGITGEDVTAAVKTLAIKGVPTVANAPLTETGRPASFEVRGEVFLSDADFPRASAIRQSVGGAPFKNPRNAAAGILRKGDPAMTGLLTFAAYDAMFAPLNTVFWTHDEVMTTVERSGITTARSLLLDRVNTATTDPEQVVADINFMGAQRADLGFPIDGAVVKAATYEGRAALGQGTRAPNWAKAFKYPPIEVPTTVVAIHETVGKTGRLGLQFEFVPVMVDGSQVQFASAHNVDWLLTRDIRVGDTVMLVKRGDVIPYPEYVLLERRPADSQPWEPPAADPLGNPWDKSTKLWRSTSPELSVSGAIADAAHRDVLDLEGLGDEIATALVDQDLVRDVADLFYLDVNTLANLPLDGGRLVGTKVAAKIIAEIEKAKNANWGRVITSLSIRMTGRTMGRRLAAAFPTMDALRAATVTDLARVDGVGDVKAAVIRAGLDDLIARGVLDRLATAGVNTGTPTADTNNAQPLAGMTIVVSGEVPGYTRTTVAEFIESLGGKASSSVSKNTSLLVSEPSSTGKYVKAQELGVRIATPSEFLAITQQGA